METTKTIRPVKVNLSIIKLTAELIERLCPELKEFSDSIVSSAAEISTALEKQQTP